LKKGIESLKINNAIIINRKNIEVGVATDKSLMAEFLVSGFDITNYLPKII
jgi:hypothetical protein